MIEGVEEETLKEWADECKEKFDKLFIETIQKALTGEIGTNSQMVEELKDLNCRFEDEMEDYANGVIGDLDGGWIEHFENAEREGTNVIFVAKDCLECLGIAAKVMNEQKYFVNEDGKVSDEFGNRLSSDLEHRVFEVIPCGKQ